MATRKQSRSPGLLLRNAGIFNPVLVQAVGLCPVIAMANTLGGAALLALVAAVTITLSELIASMFLKVIPRWVRTGIYIILGGAMITPFMILIEELNPALFGSLGIYLPVMAVNSLLVLRCERFAVKLSPVAALKDGFTASIGYAAVLILVGIVREVLGSGSIAGFKFFEGRTLSGLLLPFGGFLMLGFAAAALRTFISAYWPKFLDKKQPKPDTKKRHTAKPEKRVPVQELPDLTPEDDPFGLSAFPGAFVDDMPSNAQNKGIYGEIIIEEPEIIQSTGIRILSVNDSHNKVVQIEEASDTVENIELPAEDTPEEFAFTTTDSEAAVYVEEEKAEDKPESIEETTEDETMDDTDSEDTAEESEAEKDAEEPETAAEESDEDTSEEITEEAEEVPVEESAKELETPAENKSDIVEDDELEMLLNRPIDDIFRKPGEDKK